MSLQHTEPEEVEGLRLTQATSLAIGSRMAAELDEARLVRVQREREPRHALIEVRQEPLGLGLVREAGDDVVGIAHEDDVALGVASPPLMRPEVEDVMQVDVRQQRRDDAPNAKGNFRFERTIGHWRDGFMLDLRRKR